MTNLFLYNFYHNNCNHKFQKDQLDINLNPYLIYIQFRKAKQESLIYQDFLFLNQRKTLINLINIQFKFSGSSSSFQEMLPSPIRFRNPLSLFVVSNDYIKVLFKHDLNIWQAELKSMSMSIAKAIIFSSSIIYSFS